MLTPENRVKNKIRQWLRANGHYVFSPVQMGMGASTLDLLCCIDSQFVGVEVKREGGKPTARQSEVIKEIIHAGGAAFCCDSFEQFLHIVKRL